MNEFVRKFDTIRFIATWSIFMNFFRIFHFLNLNLNFEFWPVRYRPKPEPVMLTLLMPTELWDRNSLCLLERMSGWQLGRLLHVSFIKKESSNWGLRFAFVCDVKHVTAAASHRECRNSSTADDASHANRTAQAPVSREHPWCDLQAGQAGVKRLDVISKTVQTWSLSWIVGEWNLVCEIENATSSETRKQTENIWNISSRG